MHTAKIKGNKKNTTNAWHIVFMWKPYNGKNHETTDFHYKTEVQQKDLQVSIKQRIPS